MWSRSRRPGTGRPFRMGSARPATTTSPGWRLNWSASPGLIDLVGHDWGGGHVVRVVNARPELVRSWATDIAGRFDPEYVWHERAQVWQTPGAGEARPGPTTRPTTRAADGDVPGTGHVQGRGRQQHRCLRPRDGTLHPVAVSLSRPAEDGRVGRRSGGAAYTTWSGDHPHRRSLHRREGARAGDGGTGRGAGGNPHRAWPLVDVSGPAARRRAALRSFLA